MSKEFAKNLFNKQVMATDGTEIGILSNVVVEIKGGNVIDMMITPNPNFDTSRYRKADNFILMFVGWKLVSICSFGLIGYYYRDEKAHWIGGPAPFPFQKPSRNGLKALLMTTFGDTALLAGIIILYLYSHTFNFLELLQTAGTWLPASSPGSGSGFPHCLPNK